MVVSGSKKRPIQSSSIGSNNNNNDNNVTARLLVLGDKQVGKSAAIVRFTTGRYIQEYSDSTSDWLYKHQLGFDQKRNQTTSVELLEQRDIKFSNSSKFFSSSIQDQQQQQQQNHHQSLASRVAQDQQLANELHEKQEMLNKLRWADAYVVIYAINEKSTFNKAIKYLNLIANNINSPIDTHHSSCGCNSGCSNGIGAAASSNGTTSRNGNMGTNFFNRLSSGSQTGSCNNGGKSKLSPNHMGNCNCSQNYATNTHRRSILLLGNKRDLERSCRQVSTKDGRLLAMRHQTMFAEISIAESNKLIESYLCNLIEQIEPISLHPTLDNLNQLDQTTGQPSSKNQTLHKWKPNVEAALCQSSIHLAAPVWGSLVKSKPLGSTMVAQSSKLASAKLEVSDINSALKPVKVLVAKSVEVDGAKRQQTDGCSPLGGSSGVQQFTRATIQPQPTAMRCTNLTSTAGAPGNNNYQNKYRNLKSSFKRASMAIVSTKALASRGSKMVGNLKRSSTTSSSEHDSSSVTSGQSGRTNSDYSQNNNNPTNSTNRKGDTLPPIKPNLPISDKFKRPLFKYRGRRTTVALEEIGDRNESSLVECASQKNSTTGSQMNLLLNQSKLSLNKANGKNGSFPHGTRCDLARNNSARSSSSLSASDTNYSSSLALCDLERPISLGAGRLTSAGSSNCSSRASQTASLTLIRHNSNTTLSHASTSGGSYEESGDELIGSNSIDTKGNEVAQNLRIKKCESVGLNELLVGYHHSPPVTKKRYDLVKSVQSTFSNLTGSSNVTGQPPKRSFCSTLFRHPNPDGTTIVKKIVAPPVVDMAKTENIRPMPAMVGFCQ